MSDALKEILYDILSILSTINSDSNHDTGTQNYIDTVFEKIEKVGVTNNE